MIQYIDLIIQLNHIKNGWKKMLIGTIVGGIAYFFLGYVAYAVLLDNFFMANAGSATGVYKTDDMQFWPLFLGNLSQAALLTYIFTVWAGINSLGEGLKAGAIIGFLMTAGFDMISYDTTYLATMTSTIADIAVYTFISAIVGGVIGAVTGK